MTRRPLSLVVRLTLSIGFVIAAVLLSFGWIMERSINQHFIQQDVDELNSMVRAIEQLLATTPADGQEHSLSQRFESVATGHHNSQYQLSNALGSPIYSTPSFSLERVALETPVVSNITTESVTVWAHKGETFRGAVLRLEPHNYQLIVATDIGFHLRYLEEFKDYLSMVTFVACLIALLATWFAVYQGHAPLRRISRDIRRIRFDQMHIRLQSQSVPAELAELTDSFNAMIARLEEVFRRLSDFSADIAHELRTPMTNLRTQTEVALTQARSVEQYREVLYSNLEEYDRMAKMVGDMLFLAQADNQLLKPELVDIDLEAELSNLFDYFSAWAEELGVVLESTGKQVYIRGDRLMMRRALSNLLSNAIQHTPKGGRVIASLSTHSKGVIIRVENYGVSIAEAHLEHIFERFYRLDKARQHSGEGAGLGLAITKSIVEAHGGVIRAFSTAQMTVFEIDVPLLAN